ncbi:flavin oxidoreductase [Flammeovirga sp. MY04]|uniref:flavin reductase family protein n=1 Tax=Flammeovirga sp. MY04 TaxID=1191459 RepID=UPI000825EFC2|nr:flavin reductase [Flammeovirga sp. MY04]QJD09418.1 flavin oxidoreductase [Flammeovirga sp. MY04]
MHLTKYLIKEMNRVKRLNLINSITGIKPANLIGSSSVKYGDNLAIFSSVVHLGSDPALLGFISRPSQDVPRHTLRNIYENNVYTINHVNTNQIMRAHYTSAKMYDQDSEFEKCHFTPEYIDGFNAPFVKEAKVKIGLELKESIPIKSNNTVMIVGEIQHIFIPEEAITEQGYLRLDKIDATGISGLNSYYSFNYLNSFPYARKKDLETLNLKLSDEKATSTS